MKQSYFTSPGFTFRLQPFGTTTALFLLFFLLNFSFGFGQGVTISSEEPNPTQNNPIGISIEFDERINGFEESDINVSEGFLSNFHIEWPDFEYTGVSERLNDFEVTVNFFGETDFSAASNSVIAIDIDDAGFIYALTLDEGVFKYNPNGSLVLGNPLIDANELNEPRDLAVDGYGNIFIANSGADQVLKFDNNGGNMEILNSSPSLAAPSGLAISSDGRIYVADTENDRVFIFNNDGTEAGEIYNDTEEEGLTDPVRLAVDNSYNVYVTDAGNNRVQIYSSDGNHINTINGNTEDLRNPGSLVVDDYGFLYIADFDGVNLNAFLNFEDIEPLEAINLIFAEHRIQVYHTGDLNDPPKTIKENLNVPVDVALQPCGYLAVNNSDADSENFPTIKFIFDFKTYEILPTKFTAALEINAECIPAEVSINGEVGVDANCNSISASDEFSIIWDQTKPEVQTCYQEDQTVEMGDEIPNYGEEGLVVFEENCEGTLDFDQTPAPGTEISQQTTTVRITATDEAGNVSDVCSFDLVVGQQNTPPEAKDDTYDVDQDDILPISAPGILANDTDDDEDALTAILVNDVSSGTLNFNSDGSFTYEPAAGFVGEDSFTYRATDDEEESNLATVTITVNAVIPPNIPPVAEDDTYNVDQDDILPISAPGILANDTDDDEDALTAILVNDVSSGTLNFNSDGSFTYEPEAGFVGEDSFTYRATDGEEESNLATVTITVNATDPAAPQFNTCPTLIQRNINTVECEALVIFDEPTASDDSGELAVNLVSELGSGDLFPVGTTTVTYEATGQNGETIICSFLVEIIDENLPEIVLCPENIEVEIASGENAIPVTYPNPEFTDRCGIVDIQRTGPASGEDFPLGRTVVTYTAFDENDNEISCSFEVLVERENEPAEFEYRCIEEAETPNITLDEDCELNIPSYTFFVQAQNFNPAMTQTYEKLTEDTYLITVEIREFGSDEFVGECEFSVNIVDLIPPTISCPNDQLESFDPDTGFEVPNYENMAGISDNCGEVSFRQEPAAGEIIYNNTTVNLFVEDEGGQEASCSFELELTEADVLNISCLIDKNVNPDDNCSFWLPDYTSNADVNFPGANITQTPPVGTILTESTQIKLTASLNGETDECYFMVNLVDDQDPVANCVSGYVVNLDNNGTASITPEDLDNNSTDNCGIVSRALSQVDFTTADIGNVSVTLTVRDDAGNIDSCETTVEVRGEASGEFECRENIEGFLDENGEANLNIQELYTGDASGLNLEASRLNFTCEDLGAAFIQLDYSGDETGSCTINVNVRDELPPEINTNLVELTLDNEGFAYLEESDILAEDNCSEELIYRFSKSVFTCKDVGMNSVNVEVEDINGNRSDKNIQVNISGEGCDLPEPGENEYLFIYPNPNNGIFTIATPEGMFIEQVRVFDSRGRYIMQQDYNANARFYRMTIQGVEESVYTLQIFTNEGVIVKRAIIKR